MTREGERHVVVGEQPVNRRLVRRAAAAAPAPISRVAQERLRASQARGVLGAPLAEQLRPAAAPRSTGGVPVVGAVTGTVGAVLGFLGWLQAAPLLAGAGAVGLLAGGVLAWRGRRGGRHEIVDAAVAAPWLGADEVETLDDALDTVARELPASLLPPLLALKAVIVRVGRHPAASAVDEHFTVEDRMYVLECVRRYLPDSLAAYLAVPAGQREQPLAEGASAQSLLAAQLALLTRELETREEKLARSASEALLRQQRFLQAKSRS